MRSALESRVLRLHPGEDLRPRLEHLVADAGLAAAAIVTCVGSLQQAVLRMAGAQTTTTLTGPFEIVSLVGTLGAGGSHLHIALADAHGQMVGGHVAATGCIVHTTAEIVLGVLPELHFAREPDPRSGCQELVVRSRDASPRA